MSIYAKSIAALILLGLLYGAYWSIERRGYIRGTSEVRAEWQAEKLAAERQAENNRLLAQSRINKIDHAGAAKAKKRAEVDQSLIAKVPEYAPSSLPFLPGSVRVLHDAAATGKEIDSTSQANDSSVSVGNLIATTIRNYSAARSDQAALEELQAIVRASGCFDVEDE